MNDDSLEDSLRSLKVPPPRPEKVEESLHAARAALTESAEARGTQRPGRRGWIGLAAAAAILLFAVVPWFHNPHREEGPRHTSAPWLLGVEDSRRVLGEMRALFPSRLRAVVVQEGGLAVRLHDEPNPTSDQAILLELRAPGRKPVQVISFSGQVVETSVADESIRLELFCTGDDEVLVTGDDFVWTPNDTVGLKGYQIQARLLEASM